MSDVKIGYGAQFYMDSALGAETKLAEVTQIGLPNPQQSDVEATHFESPGRAREYVPGLIDNGEITIGLNYIGGSETDLLLTAAMASGDVRDCRVVIPAEDGTWQFSFSGIVKGYEKDIPIDDRQTATPEVVGRRLDLRRLGRPAAVAHGQREQGVLLLPAHQDRAVAQRRRVPDRRRASPARRSPAPRRRP